MDSPRMQQADNDFDPIADFYDQLVSWAPYDRWVSALLKRLRRHGLRRGAKVLDLACGTGLSTVPLARAGMDVLGVDRAERMLEKARGRADRAGLRARFTCADLTRLDLGETFDAAVCIHSGFDYIGDLAELGESFRRVRAHLREGGLFAFDKCLDEPDFYRDPRKDNRVLTDATAVLEYVWDRERKCLQQHCVILRARDDGMIERAEVLHRLLAVRWDELERMLRESGFETLEPVRQFTVPDPGFGIFRAV